MLSSNIDYYLLVYHMNAGDIVEAPSGRRALQRFCGRRDRRNLPVNWMANRLGKRTTLFIIFGLNLLAESRNGSFSPRQPMEILLDPSLRPRGPRLTSLLTLCSPMSVTTMNCVTGCVAKACSDRFSRGFKNGYALASSAPAWHSTSLVSRPRSAALSCGYDSRDAAHARRLDHGLVNSRHRLLVFYPLSKARAYEFAMSWKRRGLISSNFPSHVENKTVDEDSPLTAHPASCRPCHALMLRPACKKSHDLRSCASRQCLSRDGQPRLNNRDKVKSRRESECCGCENAQLEAQVSVRFRRSPSFPSPPSDRIEGYAAP